MSLLSELIGIDPVDLFDRRAELVEENLTRPVFDFFNPGQLDVVDEYYDRIAEDDDEEEDDDDEYGG